MFSHNQPPAVLLRKAEAAVGFCNLYLTKIRLPIPARLKYSPDKQKKGCKSRLSRNAQPADFRKNCESGSQRESISFRRLCLLP